MGIVFWVIGCIIVSNFFIIRFIHVATKDDKLFEEKYGGNFYIETIETKNENVSIDKEIYGHLKSYIVEVKDISNLKELEMLGYITYTPKFGSLIYFQCIESMVKHIEKLPNVISITDSDIFHHSELSMDSGNDNTKYADL